MRGAGWARCSSPSMPSCTARWPQADPRTPRRRPGQPPAVRRRGRDHRRTGAPGHRAGLRPGHLRRRPPLLRHAVHQGRHPQGGHRALPRRRRRSKSDPGRRVAGIAQAAPPLPRRLQRHRLRPLPRRDPPRHQAGQHHPGQARRDAGGRLGPGQGQSAGPTRRSASRRIAPSSSGSAETLPGSAWARRPT